MPKSIEIRRYPLQAWSKASEGTGNSSWGLTADAYDGKLRVSRIYKIK